jgi:hypothetical protein
MSNPNDYRSSPPVSPLLLNGWNAGSRPPTLAARCQRAAAKRIIAAKV